MESAKKKSAEKREKRVSRFSGITPSSHQAQCRIFPPGNSKDAKSGNEFAIRQTKLP
jgi:hypothetical protein